MNQTNSNTFNLCKLCPHLDDMADALTWGMTQLGYSAQVSNGIVDPSMINVLLGSFGFSARKVNLGSRLINFNLEQIGGDPRLTGGAEYFSLMRNYPNWDYSRRNIGILGTSGITDVSHVPMGHAPTLERIKHQIKDIDVVFYGSVTKRRKEALHAIAQKGLTVAFPSDKPWTRAERDEMIARAKVVVNIDFFDEIHVLEEVRLSFLLCNHVAVISELGPDTYLEDDMRGCIAGAPVSELPELCASLCSDANRRLALAERGYETFRKRNWLEPFGRAIHEYIESNPVQSRAAKRDVDPPPRINIGSGRTWKHDFINIDVDPSRGADLIFDLSQRFPHEEYFQTWRFGRARLSQGCADYILAEHVFEHVHNLVQCMTTCIDWLRVGGTLEIEVPYDLSYGAWQDPTHVRAFNERSWQYYAGWCWYVGWREYCFDVVSQVHLLGDIGQKLADSGLDTDLIIRTPRAVDALRVKLVKRALTDAEKHDHLQYFREV
ncbi:MAG: hypothetical protein ABI583_08690 [Betaproteobacteria bacterium]